MATDSSALHVGPGTPCQKRRPTGPPAKRVRGGLVLLAPPRWPPLDRRGCDRRAETSGRAKGAGPHLQETRAAPKPTKKPTKTPTQPKSRPSGRPGEPRRTNGGAGNLKCAAGLGVVAARPLTADLSPIPMLMPLASECSTPTKERGPVTRLRVQPLNSPLRATTGCASRASSTTTT